MHACVHDYIHENKMTGYINTLYISLNIAAGLHSLPVKNLVAPAPQRLLRKIDNIFVESPKKKMKEDPSAPGISNINSHATSATHY